MATEITRIKLPHWARWEQLPQDAGQMVDVHYCTDGEALYRRCYNRSDRTTTYEGAIILDGLETMDVPNGHLPSLDTDWQPVDLIEYEDDEARSVARVARGERRPEVHRVKGDRR